MEHFQGLEQGKEKPMEKEILGIFLLREGDRMMFSLLKDRNVQILCPGPFLV